MSLFDNFFKKNKEVKEVKEVNKIADLNLKANIGDNVVNFLLQNNVITHDDLNNLSIDFGYLFIIKSNEVEGLLKCRTSNSINYFAVQHGKLIWLTINEATYNSVISNMKNMHPCIND